MNWEKDFLKNVNAGDIDPPRVVNIGERKRDDIILSKYLRIGDHVVMHMDEESRHYRKDEPEDGTIGVVVGFHRYEDFYNRINNFGHVPGRYMGNSGAMVRWFNGTTSEPSPHDIYWLFDHEKKSQERRDDTAYNAAFEYKARVGDLPETPIWEHDIVKIVNPKIRRSWDSDFLFVARIDYHNMTRKRTDGSPMPIYDVTNLERNGGTMCVEASDIELYERGNVWKWFNGQRDQMKFASLEEEIALHFALGLDEQIECKQSGNYHWPYSAIYPALKEGIIDLVKHEGGMFGAPGIFGGYKINDPDLAQRARAKALEGFGPDNPMRIRVAAESWSEEIRRDVLKRAVEFSVPFVSLKHRDGYVDTSEFTALNIRVIEVEDARDFNFYELKGGYVCYMPINEINANVPFTSAVELKEKAMELEKALGGGRRGRRMRIRVVSNTGWNEKNREIVKAACKTFNLLFADRAGVDTSDFNGIAVLAVDEEAKKVSWDFDIEGYVFFAHHGMKDLPFDCTIEGYNENA